MRSALRQLPCQLQRLGAAPRTAPPRTLALVAAIPTIVARHWPTTLVSHVPCRTFTLSSPRRAEQKQDGAAPSGSRTSDEHQEALEKEEKVLEGQVKRPWHREDVDKPPVEEHEPEDEGPLKKGQPSLPLPAAASANFCVHTGKLLTTPTRLLKLVIPLPFRVEKDQDNNSAHRRELGRSVSPNDEIQPLALLVHPQQPLSYVERLIQAELPPVEENGKEKIPNVYFRAADMAQKDNEDAAGESKDGNNEDPPWIRWSSSTETGDFIRDAARSPAHEFVIEIEGHGAEMRVAVPSFKDRTRYMRQRLATLSAKVDGLASIKRECDDLAHRSAHRLAQGGFAILSVWWAVVYYVTFHTEAGWDLVEPITYLAGLTTIMGGYLWFLYISRDLSYKAAMNITVSRRQTALYEAKGFSVHRWEALVAEANDLRKEIRTIAAEYEVDWDDTKIISDDVKKVLDREQRKKGGKGKDEDEDDGDDHDDTEKERSKKAEKESKEKK